MKNKTDLPTKSVEKLPKGNKKTAPKKTPKEDKPKKEPDLEVHKRITEICDYLEKERHTNIPALALIWKTAAANIYRLRLGYREITVEQANILYREFGIPHKKSLLNLGPLQESYYSNSSSMLEEPAGEYGTSIIKEKYEAALKEILLLKKTIIDKDRIIELLSKNNA